MRGKSQVILLSVVLIGLLLLGGLVGQRRGGRPRPPAAADTVAPEGVTPAPEPSRPTAMAGRPAGPLSDPGREPTGHPRPEPSEPSLADLGQPEKSQITGNLTDLAPAQEKHAVDLWLGEARKWASLKGFSGEVEIWCVNREGKELLSLRATAALRVKETPREAIDYERKRYPVTYELTLKDPEGQWEYRSDGTLAGTTLTCADPGLRSQLEPYMDLRFGQIVSTANVNLSHLYSDKLAGPENLVGFKVFQPMKHPEPETGKPDCYMYGPPIPQPRRNVVLFEEGRFHYWADGLYGHERVKVLFDGYETRDGFEFPTRMTALWPTEATVLRFSKLTIDSAR